MSRALWEIELDIFSCFDEETGEIFDEEKLNALEAERDVKIENIALYIKNLKAEAEAIKEEEKNLKARRETKERRAESLKEYLGRALAGNKFETARTAISWRKSVSVEVDDINDLPSKFVITKVERAAEKALIKVALKDGENVPGAHLVENNNIQIK